MFEDTPGQGVPQGGAPGNLPIGEAEDIFAGAEPTSPPASTGASEPSPVSAPPSALSRGALRPKAPLPPEDFSPAPQSGYALKEPRFSRYLMAAGLVLLGVAIVGGSGWFLYTSFVREAVPTAPIEEQAPVPPPEAVPPPAEESGVPEGVSDDRVLFGEPIDVDGDGLDGSREADLGTDPNNWDTDSDGLSDYDEVAVWKTDPLNPDSDGDGYEDGEEVKNGYNPAGAGKIFEPPTSTQ